MKVLGIETSCDETGIAIYDSDKGLLSDQLYSQIALHAQYGGVVPELASRDHIQKITGIVSVSLEEARLSSSDLDGIAYTAGPGLIGSLMVGACFAKGLAWALKIPALGVHHLEAHLMAPMLEDNAPTFPFIALLVSGGHTSLVEVTELGRYRVLGETLDDAVGEAFDKTAKLLGLRYPGGAALSALAQEGSPRFNFPRPMLDRPGLDFSYSGLKTHAANVIKQVQEDKSAFPDIAYAFQEAAVETLVVKAKRALLETKLSRLVIAGGVGANSSLRSNVKAMAEQIGVDVFYPRPKYCTDNGAMVAYLGCQRLLRGEKDPSLAVNVRARWDLDQLTPP